MKIKILFSSLVLCILSACATTDNAEVKNSSENIGDTQITLNPESKNLSFWLSHGLGLSSCSEDYQAYAFEIEFCAFKLASSIASELDESELASDDFSKMLRASIKNNFHKEFAFAVLSNNSMYADYALNMTGFKTWFQSAFPGQDIPVNNSVNVELKPKEIDDSLFAEVFFSEDYPVGFNDFIFAEEKTYEKKYLGKSLHYQHNQNQSVITFYVYPVFYPAYLREGINPIFDAMTEVKQGIILATQQGYYSDLEILEENYLQDRNIAFAKYSFKNKGQQYQSFTYLTTHANNLLKVRASFDQNTTDDYHQDIINMIETVKNSIQ